MTTRGATYHLYVVSFYKEKIKKTVRVKATDRRRAKHVARRKMGNDIHIVSTLSWADHMKRLPS